MADYERETHTTTDDVPPGEERVTYVRSADNNAGPWLIAAVVAVVAIIAVAFLMMDTSPDDDEIEAAMEASRSAGYVEGANAAMSQTPVIVPDTGAADYAARTAAEAAAAAAEARAAAERAADSADDAADNASAPTTSSVVGEPVG